MNTDVEMSFVEQRSSPRRRVLKRGLIVTNGGYSTLTCTVRNVSDGGAKLQFESLVGVPNLFDMVTADLPRQTCVVAWRGKTEMGVSFVHAA